MLPATPQEILGCLARNERRAVYDAMKEMDAKAWEACEKLAVKRGFSCFNEMVAFYTIRDIGDDAPGVEEREKIRSKFWRGAKDYSRTNASVMAVRDANEMSLIISALYMSKLQLALFVFFELFAVSYQSMEACIVACLSLIWAGFRFTYAYSLGRFLRHAYELFRIYGVHGLRAEGAD